MLSPINLPLDVGKCRQDIPDTKTTIWVNPETMYCYDYYGNYLGKGVIEGDIIVIHHEQIEDTSFPYPELLFKTQYIQSNA